MSHDVNDDEDHNQNTVNNNKQSLFVWNADDIRFWMIFFFENHGYH